MPPLCLIKHCVLNIIHALKIIWHHSLNTKTAQHTANLMVHFKPAFSQMCAAEQFWRDHPRKISSGLIKDTEKVLQRRIGYNLLTLCFPFNPSLHNDC